MKEIFVALASALFFLVSTGQVDPNMTIGEFVSLYNEEEVEQELPVITINDESSEEDLSEKETEEVTIKPTIVIYSDTDAVTIARVIHAEANGLPDSQKKAVGWCILNRADAWGRSVQSVATEPGAFVSSNKYTDEDLELAFEVLESWALDGPRELPPDYLYFNGNGRENLFRKTFHSSERFSVN